jgi:hypothetical protein
MSAPAKEKSPPRALYIPRISPGTREKKYADVIIPTSITLQPRFKMLRIRRMRKRSAVVFMGVKARSHLVLGSSPRTDGRNLEAVQ